MNRKLLILNLALAVAAVYAGVRIRNEYRAAKARSAATLNRAVSPATAPPFTPLPSPAPVLPSGYADIAQKMLFDKSRNSVVELPPPPPPPPPKPVPPLPGYHGQMTLPGQGPIVILSEAGGGGHQGVRIGGEIGPFKLKEATSRELVFEWEGREIRKSVDELADHGAPQAAAAPAQRSEAAPQPVAKTPTGPGVPMGDGRTYCDPNDSNPPGTEQNGLVKTTKMTPFGTQCWWEPVKR